MKKQNVSKGKSGKAGMNEFSVINPNAAGIDISSKDYVVSVPPDRDKNPIRTFGAFTCDLKEIAHWLLACRIDTVAMESTGIYWKQLFVVLQEYGIEVYLVNSRHVKNVTGKKTDEQDAHWIMRLHTCGLLTNSFQPGERVRTLRELLRHRKSLNKSKTIAVNLMTKALNTMNIKLNMVFSDITSVSGQKIVHAIVLGERNPKKLITLVHHKVKASKEDILKALEGVWREESLFELKQAYDHYQFLQNQTMECDEKIESQLELIAAQVNDGDITGIKEEAKKKASRKNELSFNAAPYLKVILKTDICQVPGISDETALTMYAETGGNLSGFKSAASFTSWIGVAPNNKISGGKIISSHLPKKSHPLKTALIHAANSLYRSDNPLGDCFRRLKARIGPKAAKCAMARKLAVILYQMIVNQKEFDISLFEQHQKNYTEKRIKMLQKQLNDLLTVA